MFHYKRSLMGALFFCSLFQDSPRIIEHTVLPYQTQAAPSFLEMPALPEDFLPQPHSRKTFVEKDTKVVDELEAILSKEGERTPEQLLVLRQAKKRLETSHFYDQFSTLFTWVQPQEEIWATDLYLGNVGMLTREDLNKASAVSRETKGDYEVQLSHSLRFLHDLFQQKTVLDQIQFLRYRVVNQHADGTEGPFDHSRDQVQALKVLEIYCPQYFASPFNKVQEYSNPSCTGLHMTVGEVQPYQGPKKYSVTLVAPTITLDELVREYKGR